MTPARPKSDIVLRPEYVEGIRQAVTGLAAHTLSSSGVRTC